MATKKEWKSRAKTAEIRAAAAETAEQVLRGANASLRRELNSVKARREADAATLHGRVSRLRTMLMKARDALAKGVPPAGVALAIDADLRSDAAPDFPLAA